MTQYYASFRRLALAVGLCIGPLATAYAQPNCNPPTVTSISNASATSIAFAFTLSGYPVTLIYAPAGASPGTGTTITATTSPIILTGLSPTTTYQVYLQTTCSATSQSIQTGPYNVALSCASPVANYPYSEDFNGLLPPALPCDYTVADANGDGAKWTNPTSATSTSSTGSAPYAMRYAYSIVNPANDWFFTRALPMLAGQTYQLQFKYYAYTSTVPEALEVKIGTAATPAGQATTLFKNVAIKNTTYATTAAGGGAGQVLSYTPATSGLYYIGFHAISAPNAWYLYVDDILVTTSTATAAKSSTPPSFRAEATPMPFGPQLTLTLNALQAGTLQLTLRDALGRTVRQHRTTVLAGSNAMAVPDVASLPAGVYFLHLEQGGATQVIRVAHD